MFKNLIVKIYARRIDDLQAKKIMIDQKSSSDLSEIFDENNIYIMKNVFK